MNLTRKLHPLLLATELLGSEPIEFWFAGPMRITIPSTFNLYCPSTGAVYRQWSEDTVCVCGRGGAQRSGTCEWIVLSSAANEPVALPLDRAAYDAFIEKKLETALVQRVSQD